MTSRRNNLSYLVSQEDGNLIDDIVERYLDQWVWADRNTRGCVKLGLEVDITVCHANGTPLRLQDLLMAPGHDFLHDVEGIRKYLDRSSGALLGNFYPRFVA